MLRKVTAAALELAQHEGAVDEQLRASGGQVTGGKMAGGHHRISSCISSHDLASSSRAPRRRWPCCAARRHLV
eukprot:scaffold102830_cov39-Phaeocystis_antarctica.AAC.1